MIAKCVIVSESERGWTSTLEYDRPYSETPGYFKSTVVVEGKLVLGQEYSLEVHPLPEPSDYAKTLPEWDK